MTTNTKLYPTEQRVLEFIQQIPNLMISEIAELIEPPVKKATVASSITKLVRLGYAHISGRDTLRLKDGRVMPVNRYSAGVGDGSYQTRKYNRSTTPKKAKPTAAGLSARLEEALAKIAELEQWKQDAVARYPDLAVAPIILKARELVAKAVSESGDAVLADHVRRGHKDGTLMVKIAIRALEGA